VEDWRIWLYPLGFLASIAFASRFFVQWYTSEKAKKSIVPRVFWQLSLWGNICLILHSLIQMQCHVCLIQSSNAVISWRNLNLTQTDSPPVPFRRVVLYMFLTLSLVFGTFWLENWLLSEHGSWLRTPIAPWQTRSTPPIATYWHVIGGLSYFLFASRFWIQWLYAEKSHSDELPLVFWWLSLLGACLSIFYFLRINDLVNLMGPLLGFIPYIRNLMLILKAKRVNP
jgi:lipid-A-disaccharide synthase-like uncharacterized protein